MFGFLLKKEKKRTESYFFKLCLVDKRKLRTETENMLFFFRYFNLEDWTNYFNFSSIYFFFTSK